MAKVELRNQRVSDAKRFYDILSNPNFIYFGAKPKSVEDERKFLRQNSERRRKKKEFNYAILYDGQLVGGCGIKIKARNHVGEIGYFVDEEYWGKGVATKATRLLEKICFKELKLVRVEIVMMPKNKGSVKVAERCGYKREGLMRKALNHLGKYEDCYLYAKVK